MTRTSAKGPPRFGLVLALQPLLSSCRCDPYSSFPKDILPKWSKRADSSCTSASCPARFGLELADLAAFPHGLAMITVSQRQFARVV